MCAFVTFSVRDIICEMQEGLNGSVLFVPMMFRENFVDSFKTHVNYHKGQHGSKRCSGVCEEKKERERCVGLHFDDKVCDKWSREICTDDCKKIHYGSAEFCPCGLKNCQVNFPGKEFIYSTYFSCYQSYQVDNRREENKVYEGCKGCSTKNYDRCGDHEGLCFHGYGPGQCVYHTYWTYLAHVEKNISNTPDVCSKRSCPMNNRKSDKKSIRIRFVLNKTGLKVDLYLPACMRIHSRNYEDEVSQAEVYEMMVLCDLNRLNIPPEMTEVHDAKPPVSRKCKFDLTCKFRKTCKFEHSSEVPECKFDLKCRNGSSCPFRHSTVALVASDPGPAPEQIVKDYKFQRATPKECKFASRCTRKDCKFLHTAPESREIQHGGKSFRALPQ
jgi:hypothetical protein